MKLPHLRKHIRYIKSIDTSMGPKDYNQYRVTVRNNGKPIPEETNTTNNLNNNNNITNDNNDNTANENIKKKNNTWIFS